MVTPSIKSVVLVKFPFSDLSNAKLRPAIVLRSAGNGDWMLCQLTSQSYHGLNAIEIKNSDFDSGRLDRISYARPDKIFTANRSIITKHIGMLQTKKFKVIVEAITSALNESIPS